MSPLKVFDMNSAAFDQAFGPFLKTGRDLVLFDQRGVGFSNPALDCTDYQEIGVDLLDEQIDGVTLEPEEAQRRAFDALVACGRTLSQAANLKMYHTAQSAADVDALRRVLGYNQVNLIGVSYGTKLALTVMRDFPEGVRSVVLDSVYPLDADLYLEMPADLDRALQTLFDRCAGDPSCSAAYPGLRQTFFATVEKLNVQPARLALTDFLTGERYPSKLNGNAFIGLIFSLLYETEVIPLLPQIITETYHGEYDKVKIVRSSLLLQGELNSQGMMLSVQCHDEAPFGSKEAYLKALEEHPEIAGMFGGANLGGMLYDLCAEWDAGEAGPVENQPVVSDLPALVLAGELDPITPPAWGEKAAGALPNSFFYLFPGVGHGASTSGDCPVEILAQFLDNPHQPPDAGCIAEMVLDFQVPTSLDDLSFQPVYVPPLQKTLLVPAGWSQETPGYFTSPDQVYELAVQAVSGISQVNFLFDWGVGDPLETVTISGLFWTIYKFQRQDLYPRGYLAVSPDENGFYAVIVMSGPETYQPMKAKVLLPVLEGFSVGEY